MANEITAPTVRPINAQADAATALVELIRMFGDLPGAYVKIHAQVTSLQPRLELQVDNPAAFEAWRSALGMAPAEVTLHAPSDEYVWLSATGIFRGVRLQLDGFGVPLTAEQANTVQEHSAEAPAVAA